VSGCLAVGDGRTLRLCARGTIKSDLHHAATPAGDAIGLAHFESAGILQHFD